MSNYKISRLCQISSFNQALDKYPNYVSQVFLFPVSYEKSLKTSWLLVFVVVVVFFTRSFLIPFNHSLLSSNFGCFFLPTLKYRYNLYL